MTAPPAEPRFLCDEMLGKLARFLRLLGYDVDYARGVANDTEVAALARASGRLLLTRDVELARRVAHSFLVTSLDPREQVDQVVQGLRLTPDPRLAFSRCSVCNTPLEPAAPEAVAAEVPEGVRERHTRFWRCPGCRRVYWPGTHVARMEADLGGRGDRGAPGDA